MSKFTFPLLAAALFTSNAQAFQTPPAGTPFGLQSRQRTGATPAEAARIAYVLRLISQGAEAQRKKEFKIAEQRFQEVCSVDPAPFQRLHLAALYDEMGNVEGAIANYRVVLQKSTLGWSSMQEDPRILTHFGDLCVQTKRTEEAIYAYARASETSDQSVGPDEPKSLPRNYSLATLKGAAHLAAGLRQLSHGNMESGLQEIGVAAKADPKNWAAHYYQARELARAGRHEEAQKEAILAQQLAPAADQRCVKAMRKIQRLK